MMSVMYLICATIVVCTLIRYICIWKCQSIEYKLYKNKNIEDSPYCIRPRYYVPKGKAETEGFMGYVVYDLTQDEPFTGTGKSQVFTVFKDRKEAEALLDEVNEMYGY